VWPAQKAKRGPDKDQMPFHFPFTTSQVLWTLTFAAQLVLLVVLLGRERIKRFPFFTASMVLITLRLLAEVLLAGRMPTFVMQCIFIPLAALLALMSLLVVVEIARRAFGSARWSTWAIGALAVLAISGVVLWKWGPWPHAKDLLVWDSPLALLRMAQFFAQKTDMFVDLLTVQVGLLVILFGRKFQAGWRSHTQRIVIGLSTASIAWIGVQGAWQYLARTVHPHSQAEYEHVVGLGGKLINANKAVYLAVMLWWIVSLWFDEPAVVAPAEVSAEPESEIPPSDAAATGDASATSAE
jgi:hypothetical protein